MSEHNISAVTRQYEKIAAIQKSLVRARTLAMKAPAKPGVYFIDRYHSVAAENLSAGRAWVTMSVGVPVPILFRAIGQALRVTFTAMDEIA